MEKIYYEKLFPTVNYIIPHGIYLTEDLRSYSTPVNDSVKILKIINIHCELKKMDIKNITIVDATGGGGSDSIYFGQNVRNVISIEINKEYYKILTNNVSCYNLDNIVTISGNSLEIIPKINYFDIIYIDPPWGGKEYKNKEKLSLKFGNTSLENSIVSFFNLSVMTIIPKFIVVKLPINYDLKKMFNVLNIHNLEIYLYTLKKKNIIVINQK